MTRSGLGVVSLLVALALGGLLWAMNANQSGPSSAAAQRVETQAQQVSATANFGQAAIQLQTFYAENGTYVGAVLQDNEPEKVLGAFQRLGVDIRPEAMGITWDDAATAMRRLAWYVRYADLWYTIADVRPVTDEVVEAVRTGLYDTFGAAA